MHIPFCFHKCHYCDFYSLVDTQDRQAAFVTRMIREIETVADLGVVQGPIRTIFVGGGTPTLLQPRLWKPLLESLHDRFDIDGDTTEFSVEANPETVSPELMSILVAGGVNRISVGAQSFNPAYLKTLERWHEPDNVGRAFTMAREAGIERISLDLIFGVPGSTLEGWCADLETALSLQPDHLSCYALTYEPNTALTARWEAGHVARLDEDIEVEQFILTRSMLRDEGFEAYEISNFARDETQRCRHNLLYWQNDNWLAIGPSASGHLDGLRWKNAAHLGRYLDSDGLAPIEDLECVDEATRLGEIVMLGLRLSDGLTVLPVINEAQRLGCAEQFIQAALIAEQGGQMTRVSPGTADERWCLTEEGVLVADSVISNLMDALGSPD